MVDAYVLRRSAETNLEPLPSVEGSYARASRGEVEATSVESLAHMVASRLDRPVLNETSTVLIASSCSSILKMSLRLLMPSTARWAWSWSKRDVKFALIARNSGNSGKIEPGFFWAFPTSSVVGITSLQFFQGA